MGEADVAGSSGDCVGQSVLQIPGELPAGREPIAIRYVVWPVLVSPAHEMSGLLGQGAHPGRGHVEQMLVVDRAVRDASTGSVSGVDDGDVEAGRAPAGRPCELDGG